MKRFVCPVCEEPLGFAAWAFAQMPWRIRCGHCRARLMPDRHVGTVAFLAALASVIGATAMLLLLNNTELARAGVPLLVLIATMLVLEGGSYVLLPHLNVRVVAWGEFDAPWLSDEEREVIAARRPRRAKTVTIFFLTLSVGFALVFGAHETVTYDVCETCQGKRMTTEHSLLGWTYRSRREYSPDCPPKSVCRHRWLWQGATNEDGAFGVLGIRASSRPLMLGPRSTDADTPTAQNDNP